MNDVPMTIDTETSRLILHLVDEAEARRILAQAPGPGDAWATDYPFAGDLVALSFFVRGTEQHGELPPWGYYQIIRAADGLAIGGAGFKGSPMNASVEVGYGLAPSGRGNSYAAEAVSALLVIAAESGVTTVLAETTEDNIASQRTLLRAGFTLDAVVDGMHHYRATARSVGQR
jgi:RimJ/RimL family protein N-acetyltransferase